MSIVPWDESGPRFRPPPGATLIAPVILAFVIQVPATIGVAVWSHVEIRYGVTSAILMAMSALALLGARRWPGPTVAVVAALTLADVFIPPDFGPPYAALAFAIVGAIVRGARIWALASVGAAWIAAVVAAGIVGTNWHPFRIAVVTVALAACFAIGEGLRTRTERFRARRAMMAERRAATEQDERSRIARELHDVLAHSLSQISVQSGVGLHLFDREPERAREALASIRALSATGLDEVRGVLTFLRGDAAAATDTAPLTPQPQLAQLPSLVDQRNGLGLTVTLIDRLAGDLPPSAVQTTAYRIAQEALTNVVRHSAATGASVTLDHEDGDLVVSVQDDGIGTADRPQGSGVRGMRERAALAGGSVDIGPGSNTGTIVTARLPWRGPR